MGPFSSRAACLLAGLACSAVVQAAAPADASAAGSVVQTEQVRAELLAHAPEGVAAGKPLWLGLSLKHVPHWHTYWKNPGDSGLPTTLRWSLPAGVSAGDIHWPAPQRLAVGPLVNYGYEGDLLLPVQLSLPPAVSGDALPIRLRADWLVCAETCIPQSGEFALNLPLGKAITGNAGRFAQALAAEPQSTSGIAAQAKVDGQALVFDIGGLPASWRQQSLKLFAEQAGVIDHAAAAQLQWQGERLQVRQPLSAQRSESPEALQLVLTAPASTSPQSIALKAPLNGGWPAADAQVAAPSAAPAGGAAAAPEAHGSQAAAATVAAAGIAVGTTAGNTAGNASSTAVDPATEGNPASPMLIVTLGLAFVGGLLLNLMPCVFPVLSLKVLGLAAQGGSRRHLMAGGLAYGAGVLASFTGLAGLLLLMRAGGAELGWGFQLQSPGFVALLALLFTLIGLNLSGVIGLAGVMPSKLCSMRARRPLFDHALTGVLAVLIASPCTAPFMGAALGVALSQPPLMALSVFVALGLGMAAPYVIVCCWPGLASKLPRPGAWMEQLKLLLAFPMYATVVWLVWVLGHQVGIDGAVALLALLVMVAFAAWVFGSRSLGRLMRRSLGALALVLLAAGLAWVWPALQLPAPGSELNTADSGLGATTPSDGMPSGSTPSAGAATRAGAPAGARASRWQVWSPEAVARAQAEGRPVFVDFTAAWCVTCQFNKRGALANTQLLAEMDARQVLLLRADWTRRDASITQALASMGRSGVPVYALYEPAPAAAAASPRPRLLPEILSVATVREAIARWPVTAPSP